MSKRQGIRDFRMRILDEANGLTAKDDIDAREN